MTAATRVAGVIRSGAMSKAGRMGGAGRLAAGSAFLAGTLGGVSAQATNVRFVVGEMPGRVVHNDAYVIELSRPADIAHARALVAQGPSAGAALVVARIAAGGDGINRNYAVATTPAPAWSWRVTDFVGFADVTIEILDGWPRYVEGDVAGWIQNTTGLVGFWNYTVTRELGPVCRADFDNDNQRTVADVFAFLSAWFGNDPRADLDQDGSRTVADIFAFLGLWFAGC